MSVEPWNLELARVGKQVAFDMMGFVFLYLVVLASTWRRPMAFRAGTSVIFGVLCLLCARGLPEVLAAPLVARAKAATKASVDSGCVVKAQTLVILSGGIYSPEVLGVATQLRIVEAAKLIKQATQEKRRLRVIITGGTNEEAGGATEAHVMKRALFLELGENGRDHEFLLEDKSLNTYQNAALTKELLAKRKIPLDVVLVTGELHLPRSIRTFQKLGYTVCPVGAPAHEIRTRGLVSFQAGMHTTSVLNEYVGMLGYKWKGWN